MAKRKLTNKQKKQIASKHGDITQNQFIKQTDNVSEAIVVANYGTELDIRLLSDINTPISCRQRSNLPALVAGDKVVVQKNAHEFIILAKKLRKSLLEKEGFNGVMKPVVANVSRVFIVLAPKPEPNFYIIDKYLAAIENYNLEACFVLNKIDLLTDSEKDRIILAKLNNYKKIGYNFVKTSCVNTNGLVELSSCLQQHTSVFVGDSGVGKSSLINSIIPGVENRVGSLSDKNTGTHTTSVARLLFINALSIIIDSPGIREFSLNFLNTEDILYGFQDLYPYTKNCKYRNCSHDSKSVQCGLQQAAKDNLVSADRLQNYLSVIKELTKK